MDSKDQVKIQLIYFVFLMIFSLTSFAGEICPVGTKAFTCATSKGEILLNRCSTASACYDKEYEKQALRCCPIKETTPDSKKSFLELIKNSTDENLNKFKQTCNYSKRVYPCLTCCRASLHCLRLRIRHRGTRALPRSLVYFNTALCSMSPRLRRMAWNTTTLVATQNGRAKSN